MVMSPLKYKNNMLPASSIMSRSQTKKFTTQDFIIYVFNKSEHKLFLSWIVGLIDEAY